jgi:chemotaxis protein methyltransferase CheR
MVTMRVCEHEVPPAVFDRIGRIMQAHSGFRLDGYKDKCVKRRINIRMRALQTPCSEAYCELLAADPEEQEQLLRVLTIHVSHFFRNPSTFEKLSCEILPKLVHQRQGLRMRSVGCAAGEEPYSLAILLREHFAEFVSAGRISIQGSDVDAATLDGARKALYHPDRLAEVAPELLARWFTPEGGGFRLHPEIRSLVEFRREDLNTPPPVEQCDLILCRNVLIYFERGRQETILNGFADALAGGGILVLGKSESLFGTARSRFKTICPVERIYQAV